MAALTTVALPAVAFWRWHGSTVSAGRTAPPAEGAPRTSCTVPDGCSPATDSGAATAAGRSWTEALLASTVPCAAPGSLESARGLVDGICDVLADECVLMTAAGEDHAAKVLMDLVAYGLDAADMLEAE